jgi:hypothetical protein
VKRPENPVLRLYETFAEIKDKKIPDELAAELELRRRALRKRAEEDLWFFLTNVCEYADLYEPYHGELVRRLQNFEEPLVLMPRGTLKSTITSEGYPVWLSVS